MSKHEHVLIAGPTGQLEVFIDPQETPRGIALIGHPHPLFGGTADNKVVTTLAKTFRDLGYIVLRPSFRGVGQSEGEHDEGGKETDDMQAVQEYAIARFGDLPVVLSGFSFGAFVITRLAKRLAEAGKPALRLVLIGTAAGYVEGARHYDTEAVAADTIVIHGSADETVKLDRVLAWAEPMNLPITVVPGADHFFHRRLHILREIITNAWKH
jgi:alpha/beta superfamily hydrolase